MHSIEWDFLPDPARLDEFLSVYGADGAWNTLFRRHPAYLGTELLSLPGRPGWYRTVDRWQSAESYAAFRAACAEEYAALDWRCEALTLEEIQVSQGQQLGQGV